MSIVNIVKNFCERKNLNFEFILASQITVENNPPRENNDVVRLTDCKYSWIWNLEYDYYLSHGERGALLLNSMSIIEVIGVLKKTITHREKAECCVCYHDCEMLINGCKRCNSYTCSACRNKERIRKNEDLILRVADSMREKGYSDVSTSVAMAKIMDIFPSYCPICRQDRRTNEEKKAFEELSRC